MHAPGEQSDASAGSEIAFFLDSRLLGRGTAAKRWGGAKPLPGESNREARSAGQRGR